MDLRSLIETHLDLPRLSKDLDEVGPFARTWAVSQWTSSDMATLWEASKGFHPLDLDAFVPPGVAPLEEVVHDGENSMPAFRRFRKRFCRPSQVDGENTLIGCNRQAMTPYTGPGYYVARPSSEPGEIDFDYTIVPKEKPDSWPRIQPNTEKIGRLVYGGMVDVMRGLSSHVTVGRGKRNGHWMDLWFVLVRRDAASAT
jgi:hypothetical protein